MDINSTTGINNAQEEEALWELRQRFSRDNTLNDRVSRIDVKRLNNDDWWLLTFLRAYKLDVDIAYAVLLECLKWRKSIDVHNISLLELKTLLDRRLAYIHGRDVKGRSICKVWINVCQHRSGDPLIEKLFVYWLERHNTELRAAPITVLFDMTASGLQNMDLDFMKFFLRAFKYYYPCCLSSLLIFENPSVLNASWKLVRSWMDTEMQHLLQHVTRNSLPNYISCQYLPVHMGGEDKFIFTMDELARCMPSSSETVVDQQQQHATTPDLDNFTAKKQAVKFDDDDAATRSTPLNVHSPRSASQSKRNAGTIPPTLKPLAESRIALASDSITIRFLSINPREELTLKRVNGENDYVDIVVLKNISAKNVIYKFKITSPEKFRVRPSMGIIASGGMELVRVYLQSEYRHSVQKEKFLLMAVETDVKVSDDFTDVWKNANDQDRIEHKLKCRLSESHVESPSLYTPATTNNHIKSPLVNVQNQASLQQQLTRLFGRQRILLICVIILIILQLISLACQRAYHLSLMNVHKEYCLNIVQMNNEQKVEVESEL
ncbi:unnamed protein product [Anisakis simplex]|uniref:Major sperm protein n=1 Tax=Anisakis simplex TaxID=6269 RepID=A0A0M3K0Z1_ANISI|nr:unnamed protein product [Anisakis simplex]